MFAVIETGGKQYLVKSGDALKVEKLPAEVNGIIIFDKVMLTAEDDGTDVKIGAPYLEGVTVEAIVAEQGRAKKILVVKYKRKVRYKRTIGHRQHFTKVKVIKV
ncbi:MAG: 50S ribosomal protein L21 [Candidatus Magasanikbacteria bacterium RIFCSPHIGHO2_01_FULL_41_23]|uniref:Large ribosomal subunit protein bL21 n=1 Tax=Candidatus Magasanikbacteria bacterium RIFCSPLOWO2_01_FULL_40_15 TaxID=1798686 RepID=A0A1F6N0U2_9BACT|nr:MAG: 50S ribosomal protein L21 [Candidatus Magasanikbacteria bacterium RIFCSPHIGHO2_01_FULL_41_23]OGH74673.1 MAG: 50S ribosomal protein L21 [Candidatus Magasanikbacteria bacterium RIFCSPHIGHO2_12_FULL_41_16]OGH77388.1 MAG: 50S ribosomal protein L21 [Candidatus Magasanikbacteria bacterium RIFCSPLOWO2_01_FULL_40_15]